MEYEVNPKNKSPKIKIGTKIFAFTGIGGKSNINRALGNKKAKATKTPYKAPYKIRLDLFRKVNRIFIPIN